MGVSAGKHIDARDRHQQGRTDDQGAAPACGCAVTAGRAVRLSFVWLLAIWLLLPVQGRAESTRIATYAAPLSRAGPGLLLRDIEKGDDPQIAAIVAVVQEVAPDVLLLTDFDYDLGGHALAAFAGQFDGRYPYQFALRPNAGLPTPFDLDRNGRLGDARDAHGYGRFAGDGGLALLSRYPIAMDGVQDFSSLLWHDLPGAVPPQIEGSPFWTDEVWEALRLSSSGHWVVPITLPDGTVLHLLAYAATVPVFDGPEDRNGLRNRDELRFWGQYLDGDWGPVPAPVVVLGNANLDPLAGAGFRDAMAQFLRHPTLQDPLPAVPTAYWPGDGPGALRVSYVLPDAKLRLLDAGVFGPASGAGDGDLLGEDGLAAGPHRLVWVDIAR